MNRYDFNAAIDHLIDARNNVNEFNNKSNNQSCLINYYMNDLFDVQLAKIKEYVDQLEGELSESKKNIINTKTQIKQKVVRTYPNDFKLSIGDLIMYLNEGYHVIMAHQFNNDIIEYILEKLTN